jgi:hypothetical protein
VPGLRDPGSTSQELCCRRTSSVLCEDTTTCVKWAESAAARPRDGCGGAAYPHFADPAPTSQSPGTLRSAGAPCEAGPPSTDPTSGSTPRSGNRLPTRPCVPRHQVGGGRRRDGVSACRDGGLTVPRWWTHRAAMVDSPCRDAGLTVSRWWTHRAGAADSLCRGGRLAGHVAPPSSER